MGLSVYIIVTPMNHDPTNLTTIGNLMESTSLSLKKTKIKIPIKQGVQNSGYCVPLIVGGLFTIGYTVTKLIV